MVESTTDALRQETVMKQIRALAKLIEENTSVTLNFSKRTVKLDKDAWENGNQVVQVEGIKESSTIWAGSSVLSMQDYTNHGIWCISQGEGWVMYTCLTTPNMDIYAELVFAEIKTV